MKKMDLNISTILGMTANPLGIGSKLNVHKTFRRRPGRVLNVLYTFNLRSMSRGNEQLFNENFF